MIKKALFSLNQDFFFFQESPKCFLGTKPIKLCQNVGRGEWSLGRQLSLLGVVFNIL